jgi:hypothetical protein
MSEPVPQWALDLGAPEDSEVRHDLKAGIVDSVVHRPNGRRWMLLDTGRIEFAYKVTRDG